MLWWCRTQFKYRYCYGGNGGYCSSPYSSTVLCSLVALAIASIDVGVIGYMTLWNVNLDAISMITIIMSIGFSVDYTAHITYGYVVSNEEKASDRIREAMGALGWPLTQGAVSTILAVAVLADVPAYMIVTFFKTVFLAISLGLLHGLVFLPVVLSLFMRGSCIAESSEKKDFHAMDMTGREMEQLRKKALGMSTRTDES
uniref:Uncharacterized protein n=1 Tax=Ditylenchus dipsaci TaxID=166011 RepID=A0A915ES32_9BILA